MTVSWLCLKHVPVVDFIWKISISARISRNCTQYPGRSYDQLAGHPNRKGRQCEGYVKAAVPLYKMTTNFHQYVTHFAQRQGLHRDQAMLQKELSKSHEEATIQAEFVDYAAVVLWYTWVGSICASHGSCGNRVSWLYICINIQYAWNEASSGDLTFLQLDASTEVSWFTLTQWTWMELFPGGCAQFL